MKFVILESPFRGAPPEYLQACIRDCLRRGETPYASHQMLTQALDDNDPAQRSLGIAAGFHVRPHAEYTVVYTDLGISDGMRKGVEHAETCHAVLFRRLPVWR